MIKEDNLAPANWKMGRVVKVYPGKDQQVRVSDVKTDTGVSSAKFTSYARY